MDGHKGIFRTLIAAALLTVLYVLAGRFGAAFTIHHSIAAAAWPPAGIALGGLLVFGYRLWPAVFLAAVIVNDATTNGFATSLSIAVGNTLQALLGAYLMQRFASGRRVLERAPDIFRFAVLGGAVAPVVGASVGVIVLTLNGQLAAHDVSGVWLAWWLGNMAGVLIVAPAFVTWADVPLRLGLQQLKHHAPWLVLLAVVALLLTGAILPGVQQFPLAVLALPFVIWCAFKYGARAAATVTVVLSAVCVWRVFNGLGPVAMYSRPAALPMLQVFMDLVSLTGLLLAALVAERQRAEQSQRWLATIVEFSNDAIVGKGLDGTVLSWNQAAERLYGYAAREMIGRHISILSLPHRSNEMPQILESIQRGEVIEQLETQRVRKNRKRIDVSLTMSPIKDERGNIIGISSIGREVFRWPNRDTTVDPAPADQAPAH